VKGLRWRQVCAVAILPGTVAVIVPAVILCSKQTASPLRLPLRLGLVVIGAALVVLGLALIVQTIRLFSSLGEGTLAPWDPTQKLVVRGVYRFVRNPMISGVLSILLGEAALFASPALLWWFVVAAAVNIVYIPLSEERGLERRFGDAYLEYKRNVPRWIPRLKPWIPAQDDTREERQRRRSRPRG